MDVRLSESNNQYRLDAFEGEESIGFCCFEIVPDEKGLFVNALITDFSIEKESVGAQLLQAAADHMMDREVRSVSLMSDSTRYTKFLMGLGPEIPDGQDGDVIYVWNTAADLFRRAAARIYEAQEYPIWPGRTADAAEPAFA